MNVGKLHTLNVNSSPSSSWKKRARKETKVAKHTLHLSQEDKDFLKTNRIADWKCPDCERKLLPPPKLRVEKSPPEDEGGG